MAWRICEENTHFGNFPAEPWSQSSARGEFAAIYKRFYIVAVCCDHEWAGSSQGASKNTGAGPWKTEKGRKTQVSPGAPDQLRWHLELPPPRPCSRGAAGNRDRCPQRPPEVINARPVTQQEWRPRALPFSWQRGRRGGAGFSAATRDALPVGKGDVSVRTAVGAAAMEEPAAHNGSAAGAAPGAGTPTRPPATPEGMALAYGSLVLMALLPIFFGALRSVSCAKSKVPPRLGAAGPIGLAPPQGSPPGAPFHGRAGSCMSPVPALGLEAQGTPERELAPPGASPATSSPPR